MTITFIDLYNDITGQAWSMFDGEVESEDEFETTVTTSIQKALSDLWFSRKFKFRYKNTEIKTKTGRKEYNTPNGNINTKIIDGEEVYAVRFDKDFLKYDPSYEVAEEKTGKPEGFYINNDKVVVYPTPDDNYTIKLEYLSMCPACDSDGVEKYTLEEDDDYINIDEKYETLFKHTLMPLAMCYLIASETDENYSAYWMQYERALKTLGEFTTGVELQKRIGW